MHVIIYTDGSAKGNPGPGGYGAILQYKDKEGKLHEKILSQGYIRTTNNRMELMGVIAAISALNTSCEIDLYSDSKYVIQAFNENWIDSWTNANFRLGKKNQVKNIDLWIKLINLVNNHKITWHWVKGHNENELNEKCDSLAVSAASGIDLVEDVVPLDSEIRKLVDSFCK